MLIMRAPALISDFFWSAILCLLLVHSPLLGYPQTNGPQLHFDHLTILERLSHNTVYCLLQDRAGYMWIGTQNGLNRYDGYGFEVYLSEDSPENQHGFLGKTITALMEDQAGNLWVGTRKHGINFRPYDSDQFVNLHAHPAFEVIKDFDINAIYEDRAGNIWICTLGGGILRYHPQDQSSQPFTVANSQLSNDLVFDLLEDPGGTIWTVAAGGGLNYLQENGQFALSHPIEANHHNMGGYRKKLMLDGNYLWIGTEGTGLYRMNLDDRSYIHFAQNGGHNALQSNVVRDIHKNQDGLIFIASDGGGLHVYDPEEDQLFHYQYQVEEQNGLNSNALLCFWEDRSGNVWIGTYNGGINIYKPHKTWFEVYRPNPTSGKDKSLDQPSVLALHQSRDGRIWVGTDGGGLSWLDPDSYRFSGQSYKHDPSNPYSLSGNVVKTIFEDRSGKLWIGLFGAGLDRFDPTTGRFQNYQNQAGNPKSLGGNNVWSIAERADGSIWIGTIGGGLNVFDPQNEHFTVYRPNPSNPNGLADEHIMVVLVDRSDQVWVGTADHGLACWDDESKSFEAFQHDPDNPQSISNNEIRAIYEDAAGRIWIGTEGGGLNRYLGQGRFERIGLRDGLIANSVMGICEDSTGMIWISTFEGISRLNPASKEIRNFDFHSAQYHNQFNQAAILSAADEQLFFGGINGLHSIHPDRVIVSAPKAEIIFTDLKIFNESVAMGIRPDGRQILDQPIEQAKQIHLSYLDNSFSIFFAVMDYTSPLENKFSYKMEGFDQVWQNLMTGQHQVTYTNLDPGNYTFQVQHQNQEAAITIHIQAPFWQQAWFRLLTVLLGLVLFFGISWIIIQRRETAHKQQMLEAERQILELNNEKLASELAARNSKLMFSSVQMAHKNEVLTHIKEEVQGLQSQPDENLRKIVRMLNKELKSEDYWNEFNLYFNQVDKDFGQELLKKHPSLTQNDLRICSLIRLNLTTKEIASLLNISVRGVEQSRYRLKKRLGLGSEDNLAKYISAFKNGI